MEWLVAALTILVLTIILILILRGWAEPFGLADVPTARKCHEGSVPMVGGIAMYGAMLLAGSIFDIPCANCYSLLGAGALIVLVGVLDDRQVVSKRVRFGAQICAAVIVAVWGGVVLRDLGHLGANNAMTGLGWVALPFTVFCIVGVINAVNMADGLDGLAGGLSLITFGSLAYLAGAGQAFLDLSVIALLMASVLGFLTLNARSPWCKRAKVFMGDAGSMFLGLSLAWFMIRLSQGEARVMNPATALWIFALPLMDTVGIMIRRLTKGRSPFMADRRHFHHVLLAAGLSVGQTVTVMWVLALLLALIGILGQEMAVSEAVMFYGFLATFGFYLWGLKHAWRVARFLSRQVQSLGTGDPLSERAPEGPKVHAKGD